jgi:hypothetical protein
MKVFIITLETNQGINTHKIHTLWNSNTLKFVYSSTSNVETMRIIKKRAMNIYIYIYIYIYSTLYKLYIFYKMETRA